MKKIFILLFTTILISCNSENASDCFKTAGKMVKKEVSVNPFTKIVVHKRVGLIIEQGEKQKVIIETGKNLLPDIKVKVKDGILIVENFNECNFFRKYGKTKIHVTAPNITEIRNASEQDVFSKGILKYPNLYLKSVGEKTTFLPVGNFNLSVDNTNLKVWSNGISTLRIKGKTKILEVSFSDGNTRFEGKDLIAQKVNISHISSNDIVVFPVQELSGAIRSTGNVISYNKPPVVTIKVLNPKYGKLIFKK